MTNRISPYWLCQLGGWFLACLYWIEGMIRCKCISVENASINVILTFISGIAITHLFVLVIRRYKLAEKDFPNIIYYILLFILIIAIALWFVNIFINYYTYKEHYYLLETKYDNLYNYVIGSFDMFIVFGRISSTWVLAYFLYHLGRRSSIAEKEKAELDELYAVSSLNHLKKQVNPHFMFNSLNSVKALINEDTDKASNAIVVLADILRNSLNSSSKSTIPLKEEIDHCRDYLEMEKIRFEDRLRYEINIPDDISGITIPPLSIQTLVENAIKHGLNESLNGGTISIDCHVEKDRVVTTVMNDGQLQADNTNGIGIANLKKRFEILYHDDFEFMISEKDGKVTAQFMLPTRVYNYTNGNIY